MAARYPLRLWAALSLLCLDARVTSHPEVPRIASASREVGASAERIFELIADPAQQPRWDGNDNLAEAAGGQRVRAVGDVFRMTTTKGNVRDNYVVEFEEQANCMETCRTGPGAARTPVAMGA